MGWLGVVVGGGGMWVGDHGCRSARIGRDEGRNAEAEAEV